MEYKSMRELCDESFQLFILRLTESLQETPLTPAQEECLMRLSFEIYNIKRALEAR